MLMLRVRVWGVTFQGSINGYPKGSAMQPYSAHVVPKVLTEGPR